jgi:hypothetical protein
LRMLAVDPTRRASTQASVDVSLLAGASQSFYEIFNRWPTNLVELNRNPLKTAFYAGPFSDPWSRPYVYVAPTKDSAGRIQTYGADGDPSGKKTDGDALVEFKEWPPKNRREVSLQWRQPIPR